MRTLKPSVLVAGLLLATVWITPMARADDKRPERTVTVSATGTASAEPDIAYVSTGVVSEAETAREALSRNSATMKKVIDGLKSAAIEARDIQTTSLHIEPRHQTFKDGRPPAIVGYRVHNMVRVTARRIERLGEVLDQLVTLGANQLGGIHFEVSNAETLKDEARNQAMANALRRAGLYAAAAGAEIGQVLTISEEPHGGPAPMARATLSAEAVPIERGSQTLEVKVHVTWALR